MYSLLATTVSLRARISINSWACQPPIECWHFHVDPRAIATSYLIPAHWWTNWWRPPCWQPSDVEGKSSSPWWVLMLLKSGGWSGSGVGFAFQGGRYSCLSNPWAWSDQLSLDTAYQSVALDASIGNFYLRASGGLGSWLRGTTVLEGNLATGKSSILRIWGKKTMC